MEPIDTTPAGVRVDLKQSAVTLTWADGSETEYTGARLRFVCPCAACRGHAPGQVPPPVWTACEDVRITNAEAVGGYAIRFDFTDGHATGIYAWNMLWRERDTPVPTDPSGAADTQ